jgi:succinate-acetate transporter protein
LAHRIVEAGPDPGRSKEDPMEAATIHRHEPGRGEPDRGAGDERTGLAPLSAVGWKPADPAPLGLAAFAMTTFVLSMFNSNLVDAKGAPVVLGLALAYGGVVQLLAGMWEFRTGNTFGAVAFCSFGAFWISFWALQVFYAKEITGDVGHAVGVYLWAWAIFTAYMTVAALRVSGAVLLVFVLLTVTFVLLAIGAVGPHETVTHWGGYVGLATAAAAWYASFAAVVNSTFARTILPVVPLATRR